MSNSAYIELCEITKSFGTVIANDRVSLRVNKGEIHALLGENGSGKSTLMSVLSGIYSPDSGSIFLQGKPVKFISPKDSIHAGIGMIHQHFKLVDVLTAKENIILGQKNSFFLKGKQLSEQIRQVGVRYGLTIDPDKKIYNMSVSEKQTVEILKVLYRGAEVLILDEPTAVLTPQETKVLFDILRSMKAEGCSIIIITHKLNEVMEISDKVTVLRKGQSIATVDTAQTTVRELTEMMVGKAVSLSIDRPLVEEEKKETILAVQDLTVLGYEKTKALDHVSFQLQSGEILGVAGIAGSGQKELCEAIAGLQKIMGGAVTFKGENIVGLNPREIIGKGISMSFVPEDRLGMGLVGSMNIIDNVILRTYQNDTNFFIDRKYGKEVAEKIVEKFDINTPGVYQEVNKLSGGNIQKVLLGREIDIDPQLIITAYPTRGLDIGASYNIYDVLNEQKCNGVGILFIGEDLDVLLELSDRIMVLSGGKVMDVVDATQVTKKDLGLLMMGHVLTEEKGAAHA